jgi:BCD family chlorophyll transporter-like MFS transporter
MMIMGFIVTTVVAGRLLDPFSLARMVTIAAGVTGIAFLLSTIAVWGLEDRQPRQNVAAREPLAFRQALSLVWHDADARHFAIFIFISMLGYSAQDLILEPFAGLIFQFSPGESTSLSGKQNMGVLLGMLLVGFAATWHGRSGGMILRNWTVVGCLGSALALVALVAAARVGPTWPLVPTVFALGFANGVFAVAAISSMFSAAMGDQSREGLRMGLFGASQAIAFGAGGFAGTVLADVLKLATQSNIVAYGTVFAAEAALFIVSAFLAMRIGQQRIAGNPLILSAQHDLGG